MKTFFSCFAAVACTVAIIRSQLSAAASIRPASSVTSTGSWSAASGGLLSSFLRRPQASRTEADHEVARPVSYAKGADYGEDSDGGAEGNVWRMGAAAPIVVDGDAERKEAIQMRAPLSFLATEIRDTRVKWHGVPLEQEEEREESEDEEEDGEDSSDDVDTDETDKNIGVALLQQTPTTSTTVSVSVTRGQVCSALGGLYNAALNVCCLASCGTCGGTGCETRPGGAAGCCSGGIQNSKRVCSKDTAPCVPDTDAIVTTRNFTSPTQFCAWRGGIYSSFGKSCCPASCGVCGGSTCSTAPGGYNSCCTGAVGATGSCLYNAPPCVVDVVPTGIPARVSRAFADYNSRPCIEGFCNHLGGTLSADGQFCCPAGCGTCGGVAANRAGCADRPLGATMCCPQASLVARCALGGTLPCLADSTPANFTSTTSTTTLAAAAFSSTTTTTTTTSTTTTTMGAAQQAVWNNQILMEHNKLRQSAGVGALTWDATLTNFINNYLVYKAQTGCVMEHSPQANRTQIGSYSYVGENLYTVWGSPTAPNGTHVTDMWYNELYCYQYGTVGAECTKAYTDKCGQYYSYFSPTFMMVGHFTQVMWDTTTHMGCSVVQCPSGIQFLAGCSYGSNRVGWGGNVYGMLPFSGTVARQMGITNTTVCG